MVQLIKVLVSVGVKTQTTRRHFRLPEDKTPPRGVCVSVCVASLSVSSSLHAEYCTGCIWYQPIREVRRFRGSFPHSDPSECVLTRLDRNTHLPVSVLADAGRRQDQRLGGILRAEGGLGKKFIYRDLKKKAHKSYFCH